MEALVGIDHSYSHHWSESYKTDHTHASSIHWLLPYCKSANIAKGAVLGRRHVVTSTNTISSSDGSDDEIDVESLDEVMSLYESGRSYDAQRARHNMNETERFTTYNANAGKLSHVNMRLDEDWEEHINKSSWSMLQTRLFTKVIKVLEDEKLSRLAFKGVNNEPIARRLSLDRAASCLRRILAEVAWDQKLTQWLHSLLTNRLPTSMLASYLDLIQTLRSKVPTLVERMIMQSANEVSSRATDHLSLLLKRPWEPMLTKHSQNQKQKLYDLPIILLLPNSPYGASPTMNHRKRFWNSHLGQFGKVVAISSPENTSEMTILTYLELLANVVRSRIKLYYNKHPGRPIVLAGWHTASTLCCHIALVEKVSAIICLGFPMQTLNGARGTVDDIFCDLNTPALFVLGEQADSCDIDRMENFRERLMTKCESHLLAVPGADDALRVSDKVKKTACVTQQMVDKMMLDYIGNFLSDTLIKTRVRRWQIEDPILGNNYHADLRKQSERNRKRGIRDDSLVGTKRRRLSSSTTAKISQVLSGQSTPKGRDGAKTLVQGVTYNLQTGSISSLTTVPTVLGRTLSKTAESSLKHGKSSAKSKNLPRSITIDLTKETSSQFKSIRNCATPDPALLPTESQTEAAVATILGGDISVKPVSNSEKSNTNTTLTPPLSSSSSSSSSTQSSNTFGVTSAFTRIPTSGRIAAPTAVSLPNTLPRSPSILEPSTFTDPSGLYTSKSNSSTFSNLKFNSTVVSKKPVEKTVATESFSTIKKPHWTGTISSVGMNMSKAMDIRKKYPRLPQAQTRDNASLITSRSRKEERETMQATAFLEQLTSEIGNDAEQDSSLLSGLADAASYRRHSFDSTLVLDGMGRGRGGGRGRGKSPLVTQPRPVFQNRRRTVNEERPTPPTYYQQKMRESLPNRKESVVRYVMTSDMSTMLSSAAAKASSAAGSSFAKYPSATSKFKAQTIKTNVNPSILPVYTFTQQQPITAAGVKIHRQIPSSSTASKSVALSTTKVIKTGVTQDNVARKTSKVFLTQRLPVKFPGTVPGSSYTFVTIPALTGPPIVSVGQKTTQGGVKKMQSLPQRPKKIVKYSVVPRSNVTITSVPINIDKQQDTQFVNIKQQDVVTVSSNTRSHAVVSLRDKALVQPIEKASISTETKFGTNANVTIPIFTSPSVVLQKLRTDAVAEIDHSSREDAKNSK